MSTQDLHLYQAFELLESYVKNFNAMIKDIKNKEDPLTNVSHIDAASMFIDFLIEADEIVNPKADGE